MDLFSERMTQVASTLATHRSRCSCGSCPGSASSPTLARLSSAHLALSRLGLAHLLFAVPSERSMMHPSHVRCWSGAFALPHSSPQHSPGCRVLGATTHRLDPCRFRGRGGRALEPALARRTAPACHRLGPKRSWANAAPSNVSLVASSSSFIYNVLASVAGLRSHGRSL
jgi:hypothetical protein